MMKEIKLEKIILKLSKEYDNVRIKSDNDNVILINQDIEIVASLIKNNFDIVYGYYKSKVINSTDLEDINSVSITIILQYLYMYNTWQNTYKNKINQDLQFNERDFNNPTTFDLIMDYYRKNRPHYWLEKSCVLLGMNVMDLQKYYAERERFYNK